MRRLALLLIVGCAQPRTELMVGVVTDLKAPDVIDNVQLIVTRTSDGFPEVQATWDITGIRDQPFNLPGSYGIYSDGAETQLSFELDGLKGTDVLVTRKAILNLVSEKTLFFRMGLTAGCVAKTDCTPNQSCVEGVCQDVNVDSRQFPDFTDDLVNEVTCVSGAQYIDTSTGAPMPQSDDATMCPANLCVEGTCLKPPPPADPTPRTVTGTQFTTYVMPNSTMTVPDDLSSLDAQVLLTDGTVITGTGHADGTFSIPGVPGGSYMLQVGSNYYVTDANNVDLSRDVVGRPDVIPVTTPPTITLNLTNLAPWQAGDFLETYSAGADTWWFGINQAVPITNATTSLTNYTFDSTNALSSGTPGTPNLIKGSKGDHFVVSQLIAKQAGTLQYQAAAKFFTAPSFDQTDGGSTPLSGAFVDAPQTASLSAVIPEPQWEAAIGYNGTNGLLLNPSSIASPFQPPGLNIDVVANIGGNQYGNVGATSDFLFVNIPMGADVNPSGLTFGTPTFPGEQWGFMIDARWMDSVQYQLPGTTAPAQVNCGLVADWDLATPPANYAPIVGPVLSAKIDGQDLFTATTMSTTPTLTWSPPTLGAPREYKITIGHLTVGGTNVTKNTIIANITTTQTTVAIPPGILTSGEAYDLEINADINPNPNAPNRETIPDARSIIASGMLRAQ